LILERLLGYFVRDSSRPPLFLVIRFDYFLMANAIAKTAIARCKSDQSGAPLH